MRFRLLGPVEFVVGGQAVPLGRRQERCLLGILLLEPRRTVPMQRLLDLLWHDAPLASRATLHTYVARLRRILRPHGIALDTRGQGYALDVDPRDIDVHCFAAALREAEECRGDPGARLSILEDALSWWRGPLMADAADDSLRRRLGRELEELSLAAEQLRARALLDLGRAALAVQRLTPLVEDHPHREESVALLMEGLHASGRQAEALALYRRVRDRMVDDLGMEPGPPMQRLHRQMLRGELPSGPPVRPPQYLPRGVPDFSGRADELTWLDTVLCGRSPLALVTAVTGTAGLGKTALAVHWALGATDRFPDGQLYLDLRGHGPGAPMPVAEALARLLRMTGLPASAVPDDPEDAASLYRATTAGKQVLVLLDNAGSAEQVRPLLPCGTRSAVLVTSRDRLGGLVARDGARRLTLRPLTDRDAVGLLCLMLGEQRVQAEPEATADLVRACGSFPLALRIAGSILADEPTRSIRDLVEALGREDRIGALAVDGDPASTVRAVFGFSLARLGPDAVRLLCRLGLLPVAAASGWVAGVLSGADDPSAVLGQLADASLLDLHPDVGRFQLHDLVQLYARQQATPEDAEALRSFYGTLLAAAVHADSRLLGQPYPTPSGPARDTSAAGVDDVTAAQWFEAHRQLLIESALDAHARGWHELAWPLITATTNAFGTARSAADWLRAAGEILTGLAPGPGRAAVLLALGGARRALGDQLNAVPMLREARRLHRRHGDRLRAAVCATQLSMAHRARGSWRAARAAIDWGIATLESGPAVPQLGQAYLGRGNLLYNTNADLAAMVEAYRRAIDIFHRTGDRPGEANALSSLGQALHRAGRLGDARSCYEAARDISAALDDPSGFSLILVLLGRLETPGGPDRCGENPCAPGTPACADHVPPAGTVLDAVPGGRDRAARRAARRGLGQPDRGGVSVPGGEGSGAAGADPVPAREGARRVG